MTFQELLDRLNWCLYICIRSRSFISHIYYISKKFLLLSQIKIKLNHQGGAELSVHLKNFVPVDPRIMVQYCSTAAVQIIDYIGVNEHYFIGF